jgi:hypothetical protein
LIERENKLKELFEGEDTDIEGYGFDENADGLLKFVVHDDQKGIEGSR